MSQKPREGIKCFVLISAFNLSKRDMICNHRKYQQNATLFCVNKMSLHDGMDKVLMSKKKKKLKSANEKGIEYRIYDINIYTFFR